MLKGDKLNKRQEMYAQYVASGIAPTDAYKMAGYKGDGRKHAYEILHLPAISAIIQAELDNRKKDFSFLTREYIASKLREIMDDKTTNNNTRVNAAKELAKLLGYSQYNVNLKSENGPLFLLYSDKDDKDDKDADKNV